MDNKTIQENIGKIKVLDVGLNSAAEKKYIIQPVNGYLEFITIKTDKNIGLILTELENEELVLYETKNLDAGFNILTLRYQAIDKKGERINYSNCKWLIKKGLIFNIKTSASTKIKIEVRYV